MFWIFITYVRENFYLCYDGDEMVGVYSLKFELTPYLLHYGGHVGYAVVPDKRCLGLATAILRQGLKGAKAMSFEKILAVCDEDNLASEKVILLTAAYWKTSCSTRRNRCM